VADDHRREPSADAEQEDHRTNGDPVTATLLFPFHAANSVIRFGGAAVSSIFRGGRS
jgi:hypothetical protein